MLKLKLQYFGYLRRRVGLWGKTLMLAKTEAGGEGATEDEMASQTQWPMAMSLNKLQEIVRDMGAWRAAVHGVKKGRTRLSD